MAGKTVHVSTKLRHWTISPSLAAKWERSGHSLFRILSDGNLAMASGKRYNRLTAGPLLLVRITAS